MPLIAETGGINAMIVDATALPEQVTDDVVTSAFRSAGQRCSALRLLCVQDDVADRMIEMIAGAARELALGDPRDPATHVGPVIDAEAKDRLDRWIAAKAGRVRFRWDADRTLPARGLFVPPTIIELDRARDLKEEVFGPILHVVRWRADELDALLDEIAGNGTGLTLGIHSRIDATVAEHRRAACERQRLRQPQHDRRGGRHAAVRRHAACPAPARRRAGRIICAASRPSRPSPSTPRPPAATRRCLPRRSDLRRRSACAAANSFLNVRYSTLRKHNPRRGLAARTFPHQAYYHTQGRDP